MTEGPPLGRMGDADRIRISWAWHEVTGWPIPGIPPVPASPATRDLVAAGVALEDATTEEAREAAREAWDAAFAAHLVEQSGPECR